MRAPEKSGPFARARRVLPPIAMVGRSILSAIAVVLVVGCAARRGPAEEPASTADAMLDIELLDALGTDTSKEGQRFRAIVRSDVLDDAGGTVIPRGAIVYGTVAKVASEPEPLLALDLVLVRTVRGDATIEAKLKGAKPVTIESTGEVYDPDRSRYDAFFTPSHPPGPEGFAAPGEGVLYVDHYDERERRLRLPSGTVLLLALREPLKPRPPR